MAGGEPGFDEGVEEGGEESEDVEGVPFPVVWLLGGLFPLPLPPLPLPLPLPEFPFPFPLPFPFPFPLPVPVPGLVLPLPEFPEVGLAGEVGEVGSWVGGLFPALPVVDPGEVLELSPPPPPPPPPPGGGGIGSFPVNPKKSVSDLTAVVTVPSTSPMSPLASMSCTGAGVGMWGNWTGLPSSCRKYRDRPAKDLVE